MPKIVDHDARREELLKPCLELFASRGFHAISMREIAKHLGVTTGTLYHYFDGKLALFEQMIDLVFSSRCQSRPPRSACRQPWAAKLINLSQYLGKRETHFSQIIHVTLDYKRHEGERSRGLTDRVINAYLDSIQTQLGIVDETQLDALFSVLLGVIVYRDLRPNAYPIERQLAALQLIGQEITNSLK